MKRAALFVGINDYLSPISSLKCARKDADTLYSLFLSHYTSGMVNFLHDVDSNTIIKSVRSAMEQLSDGDLFLFYFAGHGIEERNNHLLLTSKAEMIGDEWEQALSVNKLKSLTRKRGVQTVIIIDSCREAICLGSRSVNAAEASRGMTMKKIAEEESGAESAFLPPVILCSCAGGQRAFEVEKKGHGIFTLALKECLDSKKYFTLDEIADNVALQMDNLIQEHKFPGVQTPELHKIPRVNPVLWESEAPAPDHLSASKSAAEHTPVAYLDSDGLMEYFSLFDHVSELVVNRAELQNKLTDISARFDANDQQGAYSALLALHKELCDIKLAEAYEEKLQQLIASFPEDPMKMYPEDAKEYKIKSKVAAAQYRMKQIREALNILDELEQIQQRVITKAAEEEHNAEDSVTPKENKSSSGKNNAKLKSSAAKDTVEEQAGADDLSKTENEHKTAEQQDLVWFFDSL